ALIVENFDPEYPLFEEAARFQRQGVRRILVPVPASHEGVGPNLVAARITELLANMARVHDVELVAFPEAEPIVWNAAYRMRGFLQAQHIRSVAVVVPAFRSRRSALVFGRVLGGSGSLVACVWVLGNIVRSAGAGTWHGVKSVME